MYAIESKHVRDQLDFRIQSLRAVGQNELAALIEYDLHKITQHETFVMVNEKESIFVERVKFRQRELYE